MKTLDQSITQLQSSPYWNERREAALSLGHSRESRVQDTLLNALNDPDDDVLQAVVVALGNVGDEQAVERILRPRYLNHSDPRIRWATLQSIAKIGKSYAVNEVAERLNDDEWIVRNEAQRALRKQLEAVVADGSLEGIQRMVSLLTTDNQELREILIGAFVQMGPKIKPMLHDIVRMGGKSIQTAMIYVIGELKDKEFTPMLIGLLDDPDKAIRVSAIEALGKLADTSCIQAIANKFGDFSPAVQQGAIAAIARIGIPALEHLHETLRYSSRKTIKKNVLQTLAEIMNPSSIPYFVNCLGSTYFIVRRAAIRGLVTYGSEAVEAVLSVIRNVRMPLVDDLLKQAEHGATTGIRLRTIKALGALSDHRAVHLLKRLAAHEEPEIQKAALASLAEIGCSCWQRCGALGVLRELRLAPDVDLLVEQMDDDSENVRQRAVRVLANGGNARAVPALLQTVSIDGNITIRAEALRAADDLSPADPQVVEAARKALDDPAPQVQAEAVRVLARSPEAKNLDPLMDCLKNPSWEVKRNAALGLGNMGNIALPSLLDRLKTSSDVMEIESVLRAIGNVGNVTAISVIKETIDKYPDDSPVRLAGKKALADIQKTESEKK